ncbi:hypothetical protein KIPE111705_15525 [Kibdelosporangium persicum]|uniref:hypothetical protein n=1 Tax=Kibdelosporangium persicum TaxID=2698649 RepID=UPI00156535B5|nr:hypothetical protein [Kibdelosporangium persicum]
MDPEATGTPESTAPRTSDLVADLQERIDRHTEQLAQHARDLTKLREDLDGLTSRLDSAS